MSIECDACDVAESNPHYAGFTAGCLSCEARMLAQGYFAKGDAARETAMRRAWVEQGTYRKGRSLLWAWVKRLGAVSCE